MGVPRPPVCADCGALTGKSLSAVNRQLCVPCGVLRAARAAAEMHAKSGPAWDAWLARPGKGANVAAAARNPDSPAD